MDDYLGAWSGHGDPAEHVAAADFDPAELLAWRMRRIQPSWINSAACREPNAPNMFATTKAGISAALAVCGECRVLGECRRWALGIDPPLDGCIVGGMTPQALKLARPRRRPGPKAVSR